MESDLKKADIYYTNGVTLLSTMAYFEIEAFHFFTQTNNKNDQP